MARINLLPWRAALRKERQRQFISISVAAAVLTGLVVLYAHLHLGSLIDEQNRRNELLNREIAELDRQIREIRDLEKTKSELLARMGVIEQLQRSRPHVVHLFDQIARTLPDGVFLTSLDHKSGALTMQGVAQSNARVSTYMRNIDSSTWLAEPRLTVIQTRERERIRVSEFTLRALQVNPEPPAVQQAQAPAPAPAQGRRARR
jgi:type IV pilus assembly protein PilN